MRNFFCRARLLVAAVCVLLTSSGIYGFAAVNGLGGKPAHPDPRNPRTQSIFIHTLKPGEQTTDAATVSNMTDHPQAIDLYAVDAAATNTGSLSCKQRVEQRSDVGSWIKLETGSVTLSPHANQEVAFAINVPADAEPGEHNGCLVFQPQDEGTAGSGNVRIRTRQAVRVAITIPGDLRKQVGLGAFTVTTNSNAQLFALTTNNEGNVSADIEAKVRLKSMFGGTVFEEGGEYPVLPSRSLKLRFENTKLPRWGGWYIASATVAYDPRPSVFGMPDKGERAQLESRRVIVFIPPARPILIGMVGAGVVIILALVMVIRRRRSRRTAKQKVKT